MKFDVYTESLEYGNDEFVETVDAKSAEDAVEKLLNEKRWNYRAEFAVPHGAPGVRPVDPAAVEASKNSGIDFDFS